MAQITHTVSDGKFEKALKMSGTKISAIMIAFAISGCASFQKDHFTVGSVSSDYRTKHPIVVSQSEEAMDILVNSSMRSMSYGIEKKAAHFIGKFKRSGTSHMRIIIPSGSRNEKAARAISGDIVKHAQELGVQASQIQIEQYNASNHGDSATLRLAYDSVTAKVHSECGQWSDDLIANSQNVNYENFGCATQNNLAEMIANPEDLISPRGQTEIDASRRDNIINDWRDNGSAPLPSLL